MKVYLKILEDSNLYFEDELKLGTDYSLGRGSQSDILLSPHPGISRDHLKLSVTEEGVMVSLVSKTGKLIHKGENIQEQLISSGKETVSVPPYDLQIEVEAEKKEVATVAKPAPISVPTVTKSKELAKDHHSYEQEPQEDAIIGFDTDEKTQTALSSPLEYSVKVLKDDRLLQELALDGDTWIFGRDKTCNYTVKSKKASRKHFGVFKQHSKFYVKDLGSSNGTLLNSQQLPANQEIELKSGDFIELSDFKFTFEIKDTSFEKKVQAVALLENISEDEDIDPAEIEKIRAEALAVSDDFMKLPESERFAHLKSQKKKNFLRPLLLVLILGMGAYFYFQPEEDAEKAKELASLAEEKRIQKEKVSAATDKFNLALRFYHESQFDRCIFEIDEFLKYDVQTEETEGAMELRNQCDVEKERLQRKKDLELQEEKRLAIEKQVNDIIESCREKVNEGVSVLKTCVDPALSFDPANEEISALMDEAQEIDMQKEEDAKAAARYRKRVASGKALYKKALDYDKYGDWKRALKAYDKHIASSYPDPKKLKKESKRNIAAINTRIEKTLNDSLKEAQQFLDQGDYKNSILSANKGLEVNRDHQSLLDIKSKADKELTAILRKYYQDSIIEEAYGEIDEAKIKWKKILDAGVAGTDYYLKAKNKLRYYEEGT